MIWHITDWPEDLPGNVHFDTEEEAAEYDRQAKEQIAAGNPQPTFTMPITKVTLDEYAKQRPDRSG